MIKIGKDISDWTTYTCRPESRFKLKQIIKDRISKEGPNCDLNDIDTRLIDDMSYLFYESDFNGDISKWDVSSVTCMEGMFKESKFNQDISNWNINNTINMISMFAFSKFNKDISNWKINKDCDTRYIFNWCSIKEEFKPKELQS